MYMSRDAAIELFLNDRLYDDADVEARAAARLHVERYLQQHCAEIMPDVANALEARLVQHAAEASR